MGKPNFKCHQKQISVCVTKLLCLTWNRGVAKDLREMGSAWGKGVREGPAPQKAGKISISAQRGRRQHGAGRRRKDKLGVVKKDQGEQSELFF
jgi:hypothetical protein